MKPEIPDELFVDGPSKADERRRRWRIAIGCTVVGAFCCVMASMLDSCHQDHTRMVIAKYVSRTKTEDVIVIEAGDPSIRKAVIERVLNAPGGEAWEVVRLDSGTMLRRKR